MEVEMIAGPIRGELSPPAAIEAPAAVAVVVPLLLAAVVVAETFNVFFCMQKFCCVIREYRISLCCLSANLTAAADLIVSVQ